MNEQTVALECGPLTYDVSQADAQLYADALDRFLAVPENTTDIDPSFRELLIEGLRLNFDAQFALINHGPWALRCGPPNSFAWYMQPARHVAFTAFLGYDERRDLWFVKHLEVRRMRPRG